jgi:DNA-binding NarL/FixJ family response regulator
MIKVMLVDDQNLVRKGVRNLLELSEEIAVVAEASDGKRPFAPFRKSSRMWSCWTCACRKCPPGCPACPVVCRNPATDHNLTTFDDDEMVLAGIKAGARGYLLKDVSLEELVNAVRTVAQGGSMIKPAVTQRLLQGLENLKTDFSSLDRPDPLTDRETEILRLMAGGYSNKEIANSLGVAEGTIKNHVSNILSKMGVRDRTRAVLKAFEMGQI